MYINDIINRFISYSILTRTMYGMNLKVFFILLIMGLIGYTNGAVCECFCCPLSVPTGVCFGSFRANMTVENCLSCTKSICQSTYNSSCPLINGYTNSTCSEKTFSNGDSLFSPISSVFIIPMVVIQMILIYL